MSDEQEGPPKKDPPEGLPAYMGTFADLMSLLMCFFVLLLSFSEMDAFKYKMVVKSLSNAFGVQRKVPKDEIPKGTSIIAQNFSAGTPKPTPINQVQQQTTDTDKKILAKTKSDSTANKETPAQKNIQQQTAEVIKDAKRFRKILEKEIESKQLSVESGPDRVVIRINENGVFSSGEARLSERFMPILKKIHDALLTTSGTIVVAGYTDDRPISTNRYRSNWELSTSRAASVVYALIAMGEMPEDRFIVEGYGDTRPMVPNDSAQSRAQNRRVEITILKGSQEASLVRSIEQMQ